MCEPKLHTNNIAGSLQLLRTGASKGTPYQYSIQHVVEDDTGVYTCVAGNIMGETIASAYLLVNKNNRLHYNTGILTISVIISGLRIL